VPNDNFCLTMGHFTARILSDDIVLQLRSINMSDIIGTEIQDNLDKQFEVVASTKVAVTPTLELVIVEQLKHKFDSNVAVYCAYYYKRLDLVCVPTWFPKLLFAKKGNEFEVNNKHNAIASSIVVKAPEFFINKFEIIADVAQ
jgi:hypothetical protein